MLELPHVMIGATIATLIPNPIISLPLALASHFLTDYVPHWNPHLNTEKKKYGRYTTNSLIIVGIDATLALILGTYVASGSLPDIGRFIIIILACFLSVAPDVIEIPHFFFGKKINLIEKLIDYQTSHQWNVKPVWGLLSQLIIVILCLLILGVI